MSELFIRQNQHRINKYQQQNTLPTVRRRLATLDSGNIGAVADFAAAAMNKVVQREIARGSMSGHHGVPRGVADNEPELVVPVDAQQTQDSAVLIKVGTLLSDKRAPKELEANAQRWNDANLQAGLGATHQVTSAQGGRLHGAAAVTAMLGELSNLKADNAQNATALNGKLGASKAQAQQAADEKAAKAFDDALKDLQGRPEKAEMLKALEAYLNGDESYTFADGMKLEFGDGTVQCYYQGTHEQRTEDLQAFTNVVNGFLNDAGITERADFGNGSIVYLSRDLMSQLGDKLSQAIGQQEGAIQADMKTIDETVSADPALYGRIDSAEYKSILVSEDDVLKQLDRVKQDEASASGSEKHALQKREAALKAQLTTGLEINAHVNASQVLDFGSLSEMGMVQNVLKRVKEAAAKGELDGIDQGVIDAAEQALAGQAKMLDAMSHLHGIAEVTLIFGALGEVMEKNNETELNNSEHLNVTQMKARQADLQKKSEDYEKAVKKAEEQQKKAEQMQKTMGCVGKILGWVVTAVSVAAAAFTGGASLALAGVGLALAAGDEISQAVTGKSFIDEAMKPVMDAVVKPIMNFVSNVATKALEAFGVSKEQAEFAGAIIGAVVTGVGMVVAAVVGGSLVKSVASKVAGVAAEQVAKFMETSLGKMLKEALENLTEKVGFEEFSGKTTAAMGRMRNALGLESDKDIEKLMSRAQQVDVTYNAASTVTQGVMDGLTAKAELNVDKKKRDVKLAEFDISVIQKLMTDAIKVFADRNKALSGVLQDMSSASAINFTTGQSIMKNMVRSV